MATHHPMSGVLKNQKRIKGASRRNDKSHMFFFVFFLAHILQRIRVDCLMQMADAVGAGNPATVHRNLKKRLPFLSSFNPQRAAKEAYLLHLQNELQAAQEQLYVSQNTCSSLRKRWNYKRMDDLKMMTTRSRDADAVADKLDNAEELEELQQQLRIEREKYEQHVERFELLSSEVQELQAWKDSQESSNASKLNEYEQLLEESHRKNNNYAEQIELLALKLEAAAFAARARQHQTMEGGSLNATYTCRAKELRLELENIRANYSTMLLKSLEESADNVNTEEIEKQKQRRHEMDNAIQSAFESALESIETEWAERYTVLETQLKNMTAYATALKEEKDLALKSQVQRDTKSSKVANSERARTLSTLSDVQAQQLREDLTAELTDTLTVQLTEQLTAQLTTTLVHSLEKKYKQKIKQLRKDVNKQTEKVTELQQSKEEMTRQQQQIVEAEIRKVKHQYKLEYEAKIEQIKSESEELKLAHKERMRKLVRALLEREEMQKTAEEAKETTVPVALEKERPSSKRKKKKSDATKTSEGSVQDGEDPKDLVPNSTSSSRMRTRSSPGVVPPVRGNQ